MKIINRVVSILILIVASSTVNAAEFAYFMNAGALSSTSAGNGTAVKLGYNGFGFTAAAEYKMFETNTLKIQELSSHESNCYHQNVKVH